MENFFIISDWNAFLEISESPCENMINSKIFQKSLKRLSRVMDKVLSNNKNIYVDYIGDAYGHTHQSDCNSKAALKLSHAFYSENQAKNRCISCLDWSPHNLDQIAVSYCKNVVGTHAYMTLMRCSLDSNRFFLFYCRTQTSIPVKMFLCGIKTWTTILQNMYFIATVR